MRRAMNMSILIKSLMISVVCSTTFAGTLTEEQKLQLSRRIQGGDREAMLEAGANGYTNVIPVMEGYIRTQMGSRSNDLVKLEESARQFGATSGLSIEDELALRYSYPDMRSAQMALARLGVRKYLSEIISELTATNSPSAKGLSSSVQYRARASALRK